MIHADEVRNLAFIPLTKRVGKGDADEGIDLGAAAHPFTGQPFIYAARSLPKQPFALYVGIDEQEHLGLWRLHAAEKGLAFLILAFVIVMSTGLLVRADGRSVRADEVVKAVLNCAGDAILVLKGDRLIEANSAAVRMFGAQSLFDLLQARSEMLQGLTQRSALEGTDVCTRDPLVPFEAQPELFEGEGIRFNGERFPIEVSLTWFHVEDEAYQLSIVRDITDRRNAEAQIGGLNQGLQERVDSQTAELRHQAELLKTANDDLQAFTYSVAHDFRAPVRQLIGYGELLCKGKELALSGISKQGVYRKMTRCGDRLNAMLDALLNYGHANVQPINKREIDLSAIAEDVVSGLRASNPHRNIEVEVETQMIVRSDPFLTHTVIENLLCNAWKFTAKVERAWIKFAMGTDEAGYHFKVSDNGAGFDPRYAERLFLPFTRLHGKEEFAGAGVGLATVKNILLRNGGAIWADAVPERGASFFFTLGSRDARVYRALLPGDAHA